MSNTLEKSTFGQLLHQYRERSIDKRARKKLSQNQLALKLSQKRGLMFNRNTVSNWETDKAIIPVDDRETLIAILVILSEYGGITSFEEADHLLEAGQYLTLRDKEKIVISPEWMTSRNMDSIAPLQVMESIKSPSKHYSFERSDSEKTAGTIELYSSDCGNIPINLAQQRLLVSASFGSYFTGLLERPNIYIDLETQIDCPIPKLQEGLGPLQRIFWLLEYAKGPRTMIIGGEGGMGKSTLSAKIIRCLHQEQAVDLILGDSAKSRYMDPTTGEIIKYEPGYYDPASFYNRMCNQLGLPILGERQAIGAIKDRLVGRKAIIMVDNLETVDQGNKILDSLNAITSRDIRAIITTRKVVGVKAFGRDAFIVRLQSLTDIKTTEQFLMWHIEQHQYQHPALRDLRNDINRYIGWLMNRTGGIPLLMQLVLSDAARYSWEYIQTLPALFGEALLDFLYQARWDDLGEQHKEGDMAKQLLKWIAQEQHLGKEITSREISNWARNTNMEIYLPATLSLLFERFMIINQDPLMGNFSIYPSLAEFVGKQK